MQYLSVTNAAQSQESDRQMMQKESYPVHPAFADYLQQYHRDVALPLSYQDLLHYRYTDALKDDTGKHTHWERVVYDDSFQMELEQKMITCWELLHPFSNQQQAIAINAIDFCEYANSMPFRITVELADGTLHFFYIKLADASRVLGMELEHLLTDNKITFLYHRQTLIETHIEGMPGDECIQQFSNANDSNQKTLAQAFIEFNENCFMRLLGDMRSYNFVVNTLPHSSHIRAIDFDQQCYEGRLKFYFPRFYKENVQLVNWCDQYFTEDAQLHIKKAARLNFVKTYTDNASRVNDLLQALLHAEISEPYKVLQLKNDLEIAFGKNAYRACTTMASVLQLHFNLLNESVNQ
jgi:hypothetical protein